MNSQVDLSDTSTLIEGFPLAPLQKHIRERSERGEPAVSTLELCWTSPVNKADVIAQLEKRIARQGMLTTTITTFGQPVISVQVPGAGRVSWISERTMDAFRQQVGLPFRPGSKETLRVVMQGDDWTVTRLALVAPSDMTDLDGLLLLLSSNEQTSDLTYQHFSEWALQARQQKALPAPGLATALDLGVREAEGTRRRGAATVRHTGRLEPSIAYLSAIAVLRPYFIETGSDDLAIAISDDGRLFREFDSISGPFRLSALVTLPGNITRLRDAAKQLEELLSQNALAVATGAAPSPADPPVLISLIRIPAQHSLFASASIEFDEVPGAPLSISIRCSDDDANVILTSARADVSQRRLDDLANRIASAIGHAVGREDADAVSIAGLAPPAFSPVLPVEGTVWERFEETVFQDPARPAILADRTYSFGELRDASERLASSLQAKFGKKGRVLLFADRSFAAVVSLLGALRAGLTPVPVLRDYPDDRILHIVRKAEACGAVAEAAEFERANRLMPDRVLPALGHAPRPMDPFTGSGRDEAYILFTSGSTGQPKGVCVSQSSVLNLVDSLRDTVYGGVGGGLRLSVNAPLAFDSSMKQVFQLILGRVLVPVPQEIRADPEAMIEFAAQNKLDALDVTPTILRAMIAAGFGSDPVNMPRRLLVGGEAFDASLWQIAHGWSATETWNVYGPTEATVNTLVARVRDHESPTLGYPLAGVEVAIVDASGHEVPDGAVGELMIAGRGVALGYLGGAKPDNDRFGTQPNGVRTYLSGDYGRRLADGTIAFVGRRDDQIKVGGQRLELGEIQACLARQPGVAEAVVLVDKSEEGNPRIVAAVVPRTEVKLPDIPGAVYVELPTGHRIASLNVSETRYQFREIFEEQIYTDPRILYPEDAIVFDVGANIGLFSLFIASQLPEAKVFAFEPLRPIREKLENNLHRYAPGITILPYGLSDREGDASFTYYPGYAMMSGQRDYADASAEKSVIKTFLGNSAENGDADAGLLAQHIDEVLDGRFDSQTHECRLRRLSDVFDEAGIDHIDVLKIDVQRAELDVLRGIDQRHLARIRAISMELHDDPSGATAGRGTIIANMLQQADFLVDLRQDALLTKTDRWNLVAWRPDFAKPKKTVIFPKPVGRLIGGDLDLARLRSSLRAELPPFMVPRVLRVLPALPRTPQGKLDKAVILSKLEEETDMDTNPAPNSMQVTELPLAKPSSQLHAHGASAADLKTPQPAGRETLLAIWREILRRPQLAETDDFFASGGDSIRAILMQSKARAKGINIALRDLHARPTVAGLLGADSLSATATSHAESPAFVATPQVAPAVAAATTAEPQTLLGIWRDILRRPHLTDEDDFFVNGGDSIRAILMQSKARAAGIVISLRDLHARPTVAGLMGSVQAVAASAASGASTSQITPPAPEAVLEKASGAIRRWPASAMQRLKLSATAARKDAKVFHNATITPVHHAFDRQAFTHALAAIRAAHPILTAHVEFADDQVDFVFDPLRATGDHPFIDLVGVDLAEQERIIRQHVFDERDREFALNTGNLVRFTVFNRSPDRFDILVAEHHAALDGFSLNAIIRELVERFRGLSVATTDDLAVFAAVDAEQRATNAALATRAFFKEQLGETPFKPIAAARAIGSDADMRQINVLQSPEVFRRLNEAGGRSDMSTKGLFFAMNVEALTRALKERPSRIGVVFSLRPEVEGSLRAIGNFLNVLPVPTGERLDLAREARRFDAFDRAAFVHKAVSFERLAEWFGPVAHFDTVFNFIQFAEPDSKLGDVHESEQRFFAVDAMVPLSVDWDLSGDSLMLGFQYDAKRLDAATVERLKSSFIAVVNEWLSTHTASASAKASRTIAALRSELIDAVGKLPSPSEDLADHGLGSLEKVQLARRVMDRLELRFPLSEFLPLRTVDEMERFVERRAGHSSLDLSFTELTPPRQTPPRLRIVGFQPVGVAGSIFDPWCDLVPDNVSIHALRWPDFSGDMTGFGFARFIDILTHAVRKLGDEPTIFVGGCFGAILAYEVACRLSKRPEAMIFIGSGAPTENARAPLYHAMSDAELKGELVRMKSMPQTFLDSDEILAPVFRALRGMAGIAVTWTPRLDVLPDCDITAVWPRQDAGVSKSDMLGWANITSTQFHLTEITGEHAVLMDDPIAVWNTAGLDRLLGAKRQGEAPRQ